MTYSDWIKQQASAIAPEIWRAGREGRLNVAVFVHRGDGKQWGRLQVADEQPAGTVDVVRFPGVGDRVCAVPMSGLESLLWHACRSFPVCGE